MVTPTFADYVELLFTLFECFWQQEAARSHRGRPFVYQQKALLVAIAAGLSDFDEEFMPHLVIADQHGHARTLNRSARH